MKNLLWQLFIHTGKIEYYLKYKEVIRREKNGKGYSNREDL
jgi:hypothetical protein